VAGLLLDRGAVVNQAVCWIEGQGPCGVDGVRVDEGRNVCVGSEECVGRAGSVQLVWCMGM